MRSLDSKDSKISLPKLLLEVHERVASGGIHMEAPVSGWSRISLWRLVQD